MISDDVFYPYSVEIRDQQDIPRIQHMLAKSPSHRLVLLWAYEYVPDLADIIDRTLIMDTDRRVRWLLQPSHDYAHSVLAGIQQHVYRIDQDLLRCWWFVQAHPDQVQSQWQPGAQQWLLLIGKANRYHRIRLLYELSQRDLLQQCRWSLDASAWTQQQCRAWFPELSDQQYLHWMHRHHRQLDSPNRLRFTDEPHFGGHPYSHDLYDGVSFRVICETEMYDHAQITEKTWQTILNHRPFMTIGYRHGLEWLRQQGFRLFEQYLPVPDYDACPNGSQRVMAMCDNISYWSRHIGRQAWHIQQDVAHNARLAQDLARQNLQRLCDLRDQLDPRRDIHAVVPMDIEQNIWMLFYQRVRDPSWPDCWFEDCFDDLPQAIQQECRESFGYRRGRDSIDSVVT